MLFFSLRRYRRRHAGRLRPVGVGVWLGRGAGPGRVSYDGAAAASRRKNVPASLSTVDSAPSVAELEAEVPARWSWLSRRLPFRRLDVVRAVSVPDSRPSTRSSRWTRFESDKTSTVAGAASEAEMPPWPAGLYVSWTRRSSRIGSEDGSEGETSDWLSAATFGHRPAGPRLSTFTRVSDGTFGRLGTPLGKESLRSSPSLAALP